MFRVDLLFVVLTAHSVVAEGRQYRNEHVCHLSHLDTCMSNMQLNQALISTRQGFQDVCRVLEDGFFGCIGDFVTRCGTPLYKELFSVLIEHMVAHVHEVCNNETFVKDFLAHSPCLHDKVLAEPHFRSSCNTPYLALTLAHLNSTAGSVSALVDATCCGFRHWESCALPYAANKCGHSGAQALQQFVSKASGDLTTFLCQPQRYHASSEACRPYYDLKMTNRTREEVVEAAREGITLTRFLSFLIAV